MSDLFSNPSVIKLQAKDFKVSDSVDKVEVVNKKFKNVDGCVLIYAPWCPHCVSKEQWYTKMAEFINDRYKDYKIGVADGSSEDMKPIIKALNLNGFPTFYHISCTNSDKSYVYEFTDAGRELTELFSENL